MFCPRALRAGAFSVLLLACGSPGPEEPPPLLRPNVVLVTVDTLRADRLGFYGAETTRTPRLDRLAAEGLVFDHATAPLPETRPSHYTLFTSLYPNEHGVLSNLWPAAEDLVTLPSLYAAAGYATAGFAGCQLFDAAAGKALGFEYFDAPGEPQRTADEVVPAAIRWLKAREARPFFLWLHLFDPHMPYVPPPPFNEKSAPQRVRDWPSFSWPRLLEDARRHGGDLPRHVFERGLDLYGGEVEYVDHWLGRFFDALASADLYDEAVIVLTADHGECFENGVYFDHSQCLGQGALAVPLVVRHPPSLEPGRSAVPVEHLDVAPTLLRLSGLEVPAAFRGRGLLERRPGEDVFFEHPLYRAVDVSNRQEVLDQLRSVAGEPTRPIEADAVPFGLRRGPWKYVRSGGREWLYNLDKDPGEQVDLAKEETELVRELRYAAWKWRQEHRIEIRDLGELDPELVRNLEALGYL